MMLRIFDANTKVNVVNYYYRKLGFEIPAERKFLEDFLFAQLKYGRRFSLDTPGCLQIGDF